MDYNAAYDEQRKLIRKLTNQLEESENKIKDTLNIIQDIIDYGFDYDGLNEPESLKKLIDMLVDLNVSAKRILEGENNEQTEL